MPPGLMRPKPTSRVLERATAEACLGISRRVEAACRQNGDQAGLAAARRIADLIQRELLGAAPGPASGPMGK